MLVSAAEEFRDTFEEIMIDEHQDSNEVQETLLCSISREERGENNIFMVGDVKQSIYRFRLARPELFMKKYDSYSLEESTTQRIDLHKNFRSRAEVLTCTNDIFSTAVFFSERVRVYNRYHPGSLSAFIQLRSLKQYYSGTFSKQLLSKHQQLYEHNPGHGR